MTKICLAIPSLQSGGMERVMSVLANNFAKREGVEVHLLMFGKDCSVFYQISDRIVIHKPGFQFNNKVRTWSTIRTIFFIRKEIRRIHPDTVLSFGDYWNSLVLLSCYGLKYPIYVSDRGRPCVDSNKVQHYLRKYLYPRAAGVIAQTKKALEFYQTIYHNNNMTVIGNPINLINEPPAQREKIALSVGRLQNTKHFDRLIRIFAKTVHDGWRLIIVGGDTMKQNNSQSLKQLIKDLQLQDCVELAGNQSNVNQYYLKSSIFVFTSSSEGFPNVIGEAMAAGLPVVSYDCVAGPSDMVKDGINGYLVPVFDDELFKQRLSDLMNDADKRVSMGEAAKKSIHRFESGIIADRFYEFITQSKQKHE